MNVKHSIIGIEKTCQWACSVKGTTVEKLLENTGIEQGRLNDHHDLVTPEEELRFYRNLKKLCPDHDTAIQAGYQLTSSSYGIWGLALQSCETILDAIHLGIKYIDFSYTFQDCLFRLNDDCGVLTIKSKGGLNGLESFMVERDIAAIIRLTHDCFQSFNPIKALYLQLNELQWKAKLEGLLNCPIVMGHSQNEIHFHSRYLNKSLNQANKLTLRLCCEQLDIAHPEKFLEQSMKDRIRYYFIKNDSTSIKMDEMAKYLGVGTRNMRRKLALEGTSYTKILNRARKNSAKRYLERSDMTLNDIAEKLGYSDSVSFSHAYKRWFNQSPRADVT